MRRGIENIRVFSYIYVRGSLVIIYIYNRILSGSGLGFFFFIKPGPDPDPLRVFFLNPYPILFFIGPGKIRPIRIGPDRVSVGRI